VVGRAAPAADLDHLDARARVLVAAIGSSSARTAREPSVITGSCSSSITVSGIALAAGGRASSVIVRERVAVGHDPELIEVCARHRPYASSPHPLEVLLDLGHELGGVGAVDEPVVVGQAEEHHVPDGDRVVAVPVGDDDRSLHDRLDVEDGDLALPG
jgi:hypothetical protein